MNTDDLFRKWSVIKTDLSAWAITFRQASETFCLEQTTIWSPRLPGNNMLSKITYESLIASFHILWKVILQRFPGIPAHCSCLGRAFTHNTAVRKSAALHIMQAHSKVQSVLQRALCCDRAFLVIQTATSVKLPVSPVSPLPTTVDSQFD